MNSRHRRIAVIGKVIECSEDEGKAMIEDGGVQAAISFSSSIQAKTAKPGSLVRVIGRPLLRGNSLIINAEIVQVVGEKEKELAEKVLEAERKNYDFL